MTQNKFPSWSLLAVLVLVTLVYAPALCNGWTHWDEPKYITSNSLVQAGISTENITQIFTQLRNPVHHYNPLTTLSWAIEQSLWGLNPISLIGINIILHILNTAVVFWLIWLLTKHPLITTFVGVIFALHPMHVESVAWMVERKDVLYSLFYLLGLISYIYYLDQKNSKLLIMTFLLSLLACLSKPTAITFPFVLLLFDYFYKRPMNKLLIAEKIPFFIMIAFFAYLAATQSVGSGGVDIHSWQDRIFFGSYALIEYIIKFFYPLHLSAFYPYPDTFSFLVWISPLLVLAMVVGLWFLRKKRVVFTGLMFFLLTIGPLLSYLPTSIALMADRYSYISYIGLALVVAHIIHTVLEQRKVSKDFKRIIPLLSIVILLILSSLSMERITVWRNGITLWSDVIRQYSALGFAYANRGNLWAEQHQFKNAFDDYQQALTINPYDVNVYLNRAHALKSLGYFDYAIHDLSIAIRIHPKFKLAYLKRAEIYELNGQRNLARKDILMAKHLK